MIIRGVTAHKHDGSVRTSVLMSRFSMVSVQQEVKILNIIIFFFYLLNSVLLNKLPFL